jgi:hypothetical protein
MLVTAAFMFCFGAQPLLADKLFLGYKCTQDCEGHKAGYDWAKENDIHEESDCIGRSKSFIEGCLAFIEDSEDISEFFTSEDETDHYDGDHFDY